MKPIEFSKVRDILKDIARKAKGAAIESDFNADVITEGFEVYRMDTKLAEERYGVSSDHVRIELVCVRTAGSPHIHRFAEAGFLFLGIEHKFVPSKGKLLLGVWNEGGTSSLSAYGIKPGLIVKVPPLLVHGFAVEQGPLWFLGVHSPLIHENNDLEVVDYKLNT